ncbi:MAG: hypothetical protein NC253_02570 [Ruminococcus sp.]|nr:hypothetical protein [Ruminococcus sp.]MCM1381104.1 hypothetical protein [Muribaculaceae bacterium]MCM1480435.1 hypothetical protein [Muribaculaceae bacterium]
MTNQELCTLYESLAALIETNNADKALKILKNAIARIDRGAAANDSGKEKEQENK